MWQVLVLALSALTVTAVSLVLPMPQLLSGERLGFVRYHVHWHVQVGIGCKRECHARVRVCVRKPSCRSRVRSGVCVRAEVKWLRRSAAAWRNARVRRARLCGLVYALLAVESASEGRRHRLGLGPLLRQFYAVGLAFAAAAAVASELRWADEEAWQPCEAWAPPRCALRRLRAVPVASAALALVGAGLHVVRGSARAVESTALTALVLLATLPILMHGIFGDVDLVADTDSAHVGLAEIAGLLVCALGSVALVIARKQDRRAGSLYSLVLDSPRLGAEMQSLRASDEAPNLIRRSSPHCEDASAFV